MLQHTEVSNIILIQNQAKKNVRYAFQIITLHYTQKLISGIERQISIRQNI